MNTLRFVCQRNIHQIRQFHKCIIQQEAAVTAAVNTPSVSESVSKDQLTVSPKVEQIADQIVTLNLIEAAQLSDVLKKRLNLPDAPMMPMGGFVAAPQAEQEEDEVSEVVQTAFTIKLIGFDSKQKVALIKEMKTILPDCNLVKAKKFVESVPVIIKSDIGKEEVEQLKEAITKVGGTVEII
ncbi:PREDICTED: 39S ribosomal protein L12, mitochondrial [Habropoda laboriosa]|nr:PREDICTED: 39S ribosomal protein L12, mitochondrial [Habropoda laboriosa]